jgi:hypothetical protein
MEEDGDDATAIDMRLGEDPLDVVEDMDDLREWT